MNFYILTFGCTYNIADSQKITKILNDKGFVKVNNQQDADIIIINTCAVKSATEEKILSLIKRINLKNKQILMVTGCLPKISKSMLNKIKNLRQDIAAIIDFTQFKNIERILENYKTIKKVQIALQIEDIKCKSYTKPEINDKNSFGIVQISEGCSGSCTYCCTKNARGDLVSFDIKQILEQIDYLIKNQKHEIYLTAQDLGQYNYEGFDLADLMEQIIERFQNNNIFIRLGMLNPTYLIKQKNRILNLLNNKIFYRFLHIPIQSASDHVLYKMNRNYVQKDLFNIFKTLRNFEDLTISTDIICGFPTETDEDFQETLKFIETFKPDIINISKYTPRPGTFAKEYKNLDSKIIKNRSILLSNIYKSYKNNYLKRLKGKIFDGILFKKHENDYQSYGKLIIYRPIITNSVNLGIKKKIKVIGYKEHMLIGEIIN